MSASQYLSDEDFGRLYLQANDVASGADVLDIQPRVQAWLDRADMAHRSAFAIAVQVSKLSEAEPEPPRVPRPEEVGQGWRQANREGYGKPSDAELADQVAAMSMSEFARHRAELGVAPTDLITFLGGA